MHVSPGSGAGPKLLGQLFAKVICYHLMYSFQAFCRFVLGESHMLGSCSTFVKLMQAGHLQSSR